MIIFLLPLVLHVFRSLSFRRARWAQRLPLHRPTSVCCSSALCLVSPREQQRPDAGAGERHTNERANEREAKGRTTSEDTLAPSAGPCPRASSDVGRRAVVAAPVWRRTRGVDGVGVALARVDSGCTFHTRHRTRPLRFDAAHVTAGSTRAITRRVGVVVEFCHQLARETAPPVVGPSCNRIHHR